MYSGTPLDIKKESLQFFFILYQHTLTAYSSDIKFTRLIPGNVCVQTEGMPIRLFGAHDAIL